jgi:hypothetical protein
MTLKKKCAAIRGYDVKRICAAIRGYDVKKICAAMRGYDVKKKMERRECSREGDVYTTAKRVACTYR